MNRDANGAVGVLRRLEQWGEEPPLIIAWLTTAFMHVISARAGMLPAALRWRAKGLDKWKSITEINRCMQQLYRLNRAFLLNRPESYARLEAFTHCVACPVRKDYCDLYTDGREHDLCLVGRPRRKKHA
jgi:hypothetical protein